MEYNLITNIESCYVDVPGILYYSHIPTAIIVLLFGIFLLFKNKENKLSSLILFFISIIFSAWSLFDIILWNTYSSVTMMFLWSFFGILYVLMFVLSLYFIYVFIDKKDVSLKIKSIFVILLLPIVYLTPTKYYLTEFDIENCQPIENSFFNFLQYSIGIFIIIWILVFIYLRYKKAQQEQKKPILFIGSGILLFLLAFSWSEISGSITENFTITQYGLFGAPIFIGFLVYCIVRFHTFNIKLIGAQALVWTLMALIGAQFFFIKTPINFILTGITFITVVIFGQFLIRSVKKEIEQKEKLEVLTLELENANEKLKSLDKLKTEFLSLASHQLRSPLTAIQGYTSMLLEGDFGAVGVKQKEAIDRVFQSSKHLTLVVEDLLNVAKIEQGGMQYVKAPFDFEKVVSDITKDLSVNANNKGLKLSFETDKKSPYNANGDMEKIRQVILNLIDNSIKYTKEGSVKVKLSKDQIKKKIRLSITDTGMGITPEIKTTLFKKFARGEGGKVDSMGTGLGLYLAKEIIEAHKGKVWAESEGAGKGSTFFVELDAV